MTNRFIELLDKAPREAESLKKTWEQAMDTIRPDLPTWTDCEAAEAEDRMNPLERFILDNEPCGPDEDEEFRRQLADLVAFVRMGASNPPANDTLRTAAADALNLLDFWRQDYGRSINSDEVATIENLRQEVNRDNS